MVKIVWTDKSINDLKEVLDYISQDSIRYAHLMVSKIYQKAQIISTNPYSFKIVPEFGEPSIRELIVSYYRIIYKIKTNHQVDILRVYHSSRLLKRNKLK